MEDIIIRLAENEKELCGYGKLTNKDIKFIKNEIDFLGTEVISIGDIECLIAVFIKHIALNKIINELKNVKNKNASELIIKILEDKPPKGLVRTIVEYYDDDEINDIFIRNYW